MRGDSDMAYVLPIEHYQYQDYQRRVIQVKTNRNYIEGPFKVVLDQKHQEVAARHEGLHPSVDDNRKVANYISKEDVSLFTGKGRNFNDYV
ncbi:hypothetical conserved protein [Oceanobacillus iheyensis HTE831]|uniref:Hypothetical conserved protein n=2 Tax=Oceanobacillus iheyensis TaxID=182710 RepID=Q8ERS4_OCEIH|nr:hypothetical conserved protein [Oceanobacillus iheyensis HTE831]